MSKRLAKSYLLSGFLLLAFSLGVTSAGFGQTFPKSKHSEKDDEGFSNWGFSGPRTIVCDNVSYTFGTCASVKGFFQGIFCQQSKNVSCSGCAADYDLKTVECYKRMVNPLVNSSDSSQPESDQQKKSR
jgi:hypothetical protein